MIFGFDLGLDAKFDVDIYSYVYFGSVVGVHFEVEFDFCLFRC